MVWKLQDVFKLRASAQDICWCINTPNFAQVKVRPVSDISFATSGQGELWKSFTASPGPAIFVCAQRAVCCCLLVCARGCRPLRWWLPCKDRTQVLCNTSLVSVSASSKHNVQHHDELRSCQACKLNLLLKDCWNYAYSALQSTGVGDQSLHHIQTVD